MDLSTRGSTKPVVALLGATGGCMLAILIRALKAGYRCPALVRTPSKLTALLKSRAVPEELVTKHLTIIQGDSTDPIKVAELLLVNNSIVDIIISGVGGLPVFKPNPLRPTLDQPTICQSTTSTVLAALRTLQSRPEIQSTKPIFIVISTTGISEAGRDVPLAMIPLYHWLLPIPHHDKKMMERLIIEEMKAEKDKTSAIEGFIAVRPSLLTAKPPVGVAAIGVGVEKDNKVDKGAIGYTISRDDVGDWIFEVLLENEGGKRKELMNHFPTITS